MVPSIVQYQTFLLYSVISLFFILILQPVQGVVTKINSDNLEELLKTKDVVFLNFYADWCHFSQMLTPIFEEASNKFNDNPNVVFGAVDCDRETAVAQKYSINKYPTLKLVRGGQVAKREYRGQRSADALAEFVNSQLKTSFVEVANDEELNEKYNTKKRGIIGYFTKKEGPEWENVAKIASILREDCDFWFGFGDAFKQHTIGGNNIAFRPPNTEHQEQLYSGDLTNAEYLKQWVTDKCIPLVREITFENAEELTEEGLPFLILFRHPDDNTIVETYSKEVAGQLADQKSSVNFLVADGLKFAHPLQHLGKQSSDLPVLAIDSFRHMYLFPNMQDLTVPGKLRQFIMDLHSGKLHREFHNGPDPTQPPAKQVEGAGSDGGQAAPAIPQQDFGQAPMEDSTPPPSVFDKLKPSRTRYTFIDGRDEL